MTKTNKSLQKTKNLPKISLNMQMKVEKMLRYFKLDKLIDENNDEKLVRF